MSTLRRDPAVGGGARALCCPTAVTDAQPFKPESLPFEALVLDATRARRITHVEQVQQLWSGYGQIVRCRLDADEARSVIVKHVRWPDENDHPRGWSSDRSHARKVRSYAVETTWYTDYAARCGARCRVPRCLAHRAHGAEVFIVLEDLNAAGFGARRSHVTDTELQACLSWLAHFHATFLGQTPHGLWSVGTYWHLQTRPDELAVLPDGPLKSAAAVLDRKLNTCRFQTLVHGDAKLANFCFSPDGQEVAGVDFQYVGGGCGIKDVAYFISSCLDERQSERQEAALLDLYFGQLRRALKATSEEVDLDALEREWRALYPVAWTDFYRFLQGWSPGHWKLHSYSARLAREVLGAL